MHCGPNNNLCSFSVTSLDSLAGDKVPEKIFKFQRCFVLKMAFWNVLITCFAKITLHQCRKETLFFDIINFAVAKDFF